MRREGPWYPNEMQVDIELDVDVSCVGCGVVRDFPTKAERVLEGDALFADVAEMCACGSRRVRVEVVIDDGPAPQEESQGRLQPHRRR